MINTEQAFDMLPYVSDIYAKLDFESYRKTINKGKDIETVGLDAIMFIIKNSGKIKAEIFEIVAVVDGKTADEVKKQPITKTLFTFKALFTDTELMDFFKGAMQ